MVAVAAHTGVVAVTVAEIVDSVAMAVLVYVVFVVLVLGPKAKASKDHP